tara:strand:+ start:118 stop:381 length:264 start_codon:yes stop_codon:yes gene_type:complete
MANRNIIRKLFNSYDDDELYWAMYNSYDVIVNKIDAREIMISDVEYFVHDVDDAITVSIIDTLIVYFEDLEEYEMCAELLIERKTYE